MSSRAFLDTSILVYAVLPHDTRSAVARDLIQEGGVISIQILNEFANIARRKLGQPWIEVAEKLDLIRSLCPNIVSLTVELHDRGIEIASRYGYRIWDALILASAMEAGCLTVYSEDMQDGQEIEGLRIVNPFRPGLARTRKRN